MTAPESWTPEFEGQRPPFVPGNTVAQRHGAYSERVVAPLARALVDELLAGSAVDGSPTAYLLEPSYRPALEAWGEAEARASRFAAALASHEDCDGCKRCSGWDEKLRRWQATAITHRQRLGLDPLSRARLGKDVASARLDVAQLMARQAREEREGEEL